MRSRQVPRCSRPTFRWATDEPNDALLDDVWGLIEDAGVPVVIHCGSGPAPGDFTGPEPIARLLSRYPRLTLIVAHMGMPEYSAFLDLTERYDNVRLDTTMAFTRSSKRRCRSPGPTAEPAESPG